MKTQIPAIATALLLPLGSASALDFTTQHGETYTDCRVRAVTLDGVQIVTSKKKRVMIDYLDLPSDLQVKFQYDVSKGNTDPKAAAMFAYRAWQKQPLSFKHQFTRSSVTSTDETQTPRQLAKSGSFREAAVRESQIQALKKYPSLGVKDSPMNKMFVKEYNEIVALDPTYPSSSDDWPIKLADWCATRLADTGGFQSTSAEPVHTSPSASTDDSVRSKEQTFWQKHGDELKVEAAKGGIGVFFIWLAHELAK